ncbi:MAG: hypothetical protein JWM16_4356 [Verrucomicrobiales bacterium]|nr:hypothetical protein [Verrucomicrobiales bacterium]
MAISVNPQREAQKDQKRRTDYAAIIQAAWSQFRSLAESQKRTELIADLVPVMERFTLGIFRLVVMGEIKKGKSSFINALLGEPNLLPTASDVATSTVFKIMYGPQKRFKVFFLPDTDTGRRQETLEIKSSAIKDYGTESGNPENRKRVDCIGIELPHPLLKQGLVIVDTPGVGGLFKAHRDITWRYAPNADAICFVLDSVESVISSDEIKFLEEMSQKVTKKIFFVQTKIDAADPEQWQGWTNRNKQHLTEHLGISPERLFYFAVSSKRKAIADKQPKNNTDKSISREKLLQHLERSGFPPVLQFLGRGLMRQKEKLLAKQTARQIQAACDELDRQTREELRIAQAQSKEELDQIATELAEAERQLTTWERETYPTEMRHFEDAFSRLRLLTTGRLRSELDTVASVSQFIDQLQFSKPDPQVLNQQAGELQQNLLARASEAAMAVEQEFNQEAILQVEGTAVRLAQGFRPSGANLQLHSGGLAPIPVPETLHMAFGTFEKVRYGMMGMGIGLGLVTVLTAVFPPAAVLGLFLSAAAGAFGGKKGLEQLEEQKRAEAIQKLQNKLNETMMRAANQAQHRFAELSQQMEQFARNTFTEAAKRARTDLQGRIHQVQSARNRNTHEAQSQVKELQKHLQHLNTLKEVLRPLVTSKRPGAERSRP